MTASDATAGHLPLSSELLSRGPRVIGATGGSGTRVLARIVRAGGMFIGTHLNPYEDALDFGEFSDRWINPVLESGDEPDATTTAAMRDELTEIVSRHCREMPTSARCWGWKEPRSIYLLRVFEEAMPGLRFVHFIRDGRDMAFSENQNQLRKHGRSVLDAESLRLGKPLQSIALWTKVNLAAADFGERHLGDRYVRVRFEDLCRDPARTARAIYSFLELEGDAEAVALSEVKPPSTLGRWRAEKPALVGSLEAIARPALARFGYLDGESSSGV